MKNDEYPIVSFSTTDEWQKWLSREHAKAPGIWIKLAKKASGIPSPTHNEALLVALCFGWIDGQAKPLDETYWLQKFTPRGARSIWSKRNCKYVAKLIDEGKMQPAGLVKIEEAKQDGRWDRAYDSPQNMVMPEDFLQKLANNKKAETFFATLNKTNRFAIAWRLQTAKKPETRERRMNIILEMLAKQEKFH
jgi:uncharacterized protein YdeI (YjbR/CyaY-like superfamily)